jgi:hypothetical protein
MVSCLGILSFREMAGKWRMVTDLSILQRKSAKHQIDDVVRF